MELEKSESYKKERLDKLIESIDEEIIAFKLLGYSIHYYGTFCRIGRNRVWYTMFYSKVFDKYKIRNIINNEDLIEESTIEEFKKKLVDLLGGI